MPALVAMVAFPTLAAGSCFLAQTEHVVAVVPQQDCARKQRREHQQVQPSAPYGLRREAERKPDIAQALGAPSAGPVVRWLLAFCL